MMRAHQRPARQALAILLALLLIAPSLYAERTKLKPGWNMFSAQDDIELGRQASQQVEREMPLLGDREVDDYLNRLGKRLAQHAPGHDYPYQFKAVNAPEINAFALPGGFLYVNRGTIEAAETEAELAGVMAHEIAHVALRHGTNQYTKAQFAQLGLGALGGLLGGGGAAAAATALGAQLGATFLFMKFSRTAERQADVLGTQMLYDAGYDPQAMADFFDIIAAKGGGRPPEFFSTHPNPENRQERIEEETELLGGRGDLQRDSDEFHAVKTYLQDLPEAPERGQEPQADERPMERRPESPAGRFNGYRNQVFSARYPANWDVQENGLQVLFAPAEGVSGNQIAYGAMLNAVEIDDSRISLSQATDRLIQQMVQSNPGMRVVSEERARVAGRRALATQLGGQSPYRGEREVDWVFTVRLDEGLFYAVFIVPESDYRTYQPIFQEMLDSIRFF
jgi:predicted Zn-dependent protease